MLYGGLQFNYTRAVTKTPLQLHWPHSLGFKLYAFIIYTIYIIYTQLRVIIVWCVYTYIYEWVVISAKCSSIFRHPFLLRDVYRINVEIGCFVSRWKFKGKKKRKWNKKKKKQRHQSSWNEIRQFHLWLLGDSPSNVELCANGERERE